MLVRFNFLFFLFCRYVPILHIRSSSQPRADRGTEQERERSEGDRNGVLKERQGTLMDFLRPVGTAGTAEFRLPFQNVSRSPPVQSERRRVLNTSAIERMDR